MSVARLARVWIVATVLLGVIVGLVNRSVDDGPDGGLFTSDNPLGAIGICLIAALAPLFTFPLVMSTERIDEKVTVTRDRTKGPVMYWGVIGGAFVWWTILGVALVSNLFRF